MVNHLLETSHPFSSSALRFCVSANSPSSILRTHFQVPYPVSPLLATLTKTLGCGGILPISELALFSIPRFNAQTFLRANALCYLLISLFPCFLPSLTSLRAARWTDGPS